MYYIVENSDQLSRLEPTKTAFVQIVLKNDCYHPMLSSLSLVYYNNGSKGYILSVDHSESFSLSIEQITEFLNSHETIYLIDAKFHSYHLGLRNVVDLKLVMLDSKNETEDFNCDTQFHRQMYNNYGTHFKNIDSVIPISKHYEKCECFYDQVKYLIGLELDQTFDKQILDAYKYVEQSGIRINDELLSKVYDVQNSAGVIRDSIAYSNYNLYNLTGRPTNSFNGINFLAIPKEGDFRKCFLPQNDYLVEFDFEGYHLRLIAKLVNLELPKSESIHKILASEYFNKPVEEVTEEEYKQSKTITFRQLYGKIEDKYKDITFFKSLKEYSEQEWNKFKSQRSYVLPTGRILKDTGSMTKNKLFNYILQNSETKTNVEKILLIKEYLLGRKTKLILITYDAFLFDFCVEDGKETLVELKSILEQGDFPVKHRHGKDYSFT